MVVFDLTWIMPGATENARNENADNETARHKKQDMKMREIKILEKWYFGLGQHERSTQLLSTSSQVVNT